MIKFTIIFTFLAITACTSRAQEQETVQNDAAEREQELAGKNVWHAARLRGVAFRAIGQEPGWLLEMKKGKEILLVTKSGQNRQVFPYLEPRENRDLRQTTFQLDDKTSLLLEGKPCADIMSGEAFETTVTVTIDAMVLKGCGAPCFNSATG